jgi:hypothetical protein
MVKWMRIRACVALIAISVAGCATAGSTDSSTPSTSEPSTTVTLEPSTTATTSTSTSLVTSTIDSETTTTGDGRPIGERIPTATAFEQEMWAVYVFVWENAWDAEQFVASGGQESLDAVKAVADDLGYDSQNMTLGDLLCDPGAHEVLGLDTNGTDYQALALYFTVESDAQEVAAAFEPHTVGYGLVHIGCAD